MNPEASAVGYRVQNSGRFAHEESYVRHQGQGAGFETCRFQTATLRQQGGKDVIDIDTIAWQKLFRPGCDHISAR